MYYISLNLALHGRTLPSIHYCGLAPFLTKYVKRIVKPLSIVTMLGRIASASLRVVLDYHIWRHGEAPSTKPLVSEIEVKVFASDLEPRVPGDVVEAGSAEKS